MKLKSKTHTLIVGPPAQFQANVARLLAIHWSGAIIEVVRTEDDKPHATLTMRQFTKRAAYSTLLHTDVATLGKPHSPTLILRDVSTGILPLLPNDPWFATAPKLLKRGYAVLTSGHSGQVPSPRIEYPAEVYTAVYDLQTSRVVLTYVKSAVVERIAIWPAIKPVNPGLLNTIEKPKPRRNPERNLHV